MLLLSPAKRPGVARHCSSRGVDSQNLRWAAASASLAAVPEVSNCIEYTRWSPRGHPGAAQSDHLYNSQPVHCISALNFAAGALALAVASVKHVCQGHTPLHCVQQTDFFPGSACFSGSAGTATFSEQPDEAGSAMLGPLPPFTDVPGRLRYGSRVWQARRQQRDSLIADLKGRVQSAGLAGVAAMVILNSLYYSGAGLARLQRAVLSRKP